MITGVDEGQVELEFGAEVNTVCETTRVSCAVGSAGAGAHGRLGLDEGVSLPLDVDESKPDIETGADKEDEDPPRLSVDFLRC